MSQETARKLIAQKWQEAWQAGPLTSMPIEFQNQSFKRPEGTTWGRYTLLPGEAQPASLGPYMKRTPFALILQVFIPEDNGTADAYKVADVMSALDRTQHRSADGLVVVTFYACGVEPTLNQDGFEAFNVTISGYWDSYRTA